VKNEVSEAVRKLRSSFNLTQDEFARKLGVAVVSVARWETSRPPRGKSAKVLEDLAASLSLSECVAVFQKAQRGEYPAATRSIKASPIIFESEEEMQWVIALLRVLRNRDSHKKEHDQLKLALRRPLREIATLLAKVQTKTDAFGAILPLYKEGRTPQQIAELLGLNISDVLQVVTSDLFDRLVAYVQ
jgi:transcriptional regulator with XRE-family HTH domain